jgi:hypothetical protein
LPTICRESQHNHQFEIDKARGPQKAGQIRRRKGRSEHAGYGGKTTDESWRQTKNIRGHQVPQKLLSAVN